MTIKEFIIKYPDATLDLMTPGGYVYLTPEKSQALLRGENTSGHPGDPRHAMKIDADEILSQSIHSADYYKGEWHMLTYYTSEATQDAERQIEAGIRKQNIQARLLEKLDVEYADMMGGWLKLEPSLLIEQAEEIAAAKMVYSELKNGGYIDGHVDELEHLLRLENPLEALRDEYVRQDTPQQYIMEVTLIELERNQPVIEQADAPEPGGGIQGMRL